MNRITAKTIIREAIEDKIGENIPFTLSEVYQMVPDIKSSTIKVNIKRLLDHEIIKKSKNGIYYLPKQSRILKEAVLDSDLIITKKYLKDDKNHTIGYYSGINLARFLGMTTQTASLETIYSNQVSDKIRIIKIQNQKFKISAPRYLVDDNNYKILQILDIVDAFDKISEVTTSDALNIIDKYLEGISIDKDELKRIVKSYPLRAQVAFYEMGVDHVIAQR